MRMAFHTPNASKIKIYSHKWFCHPFDTLICTLAGMIHLKDAERVERVFWDTMSCIWCGKGDTEEQRAREILGALCSTAVCIGVYKEMHDDKGWILKNKIENEHKQNV